MILLNYFKFKYKNKLSAIITIREIGFFWEKLSNKVLNYFKFYLY